MHLPLLLSFISCILFIFASSILQSHVPNHEELRSPKKRVHGPILTLFLSRFPAQRTEISFTEPPLFVFLLLDLFSRDCPFTVLLE